MPCLHANKENFLPWIIPADIGLTKHKTKCRLVRYIILHEVVMFEKH